MATKVAKFKPGRAKTGGRKPGVQNKATVEAREARLLAGKLNPRLEEMLYQYAFGKPKEVVEIQDSRAEMTLVERIGRASAEILATREQSRRSQPSI